MAGWGSEDIHGEEPPKTPRWLLVVLALVLVALVVWARSA